MLAGCLLLASYLLTGGCCLLAAGSWLPTSGLLLLLLLPLPLLLLLVRLNLLVSFPGALPLASAGVGGYIRYHTHTHI